MPVFIALCSPHCCAMCWQRNYVLWIMQEYKSHLNFKRSVLLENVDRYVQTKISIPASYEFTLNVFLLINCHWFQMHAVIY